MRSHQRSRGGFDTLYLARVRIILHSLGKFSRGLLGILQDAETSGHLSRKVARNIASANYRFPIDVTLSEECKDFVSKVLVASPSDRMSSEQMMQHPWLLGKMQPIPSPQRLFKQDARDIETLLGIFLVFMIHNYPLLSYQIW